MFIYNIATKVDNDIKDEWLRWQKKVHIPDVMSTGLFYDHGFFKLLEQDQSDGKTFLINFFSESKSLYESYINHHSQRFTEKILHKWRGKFFVFQSLLESVQ